MSQIDSLLQLLLREAVKNKQSTGYIEVDGHRFNILVEFSGYIDNPIEIECEKPNEELNDIVAKFDASPTNESLPRTNDSGGSAGTPQN